jgi:hypothetical protein
MLRPLIQSKGLAVVLGELEKLVGSANWSDYQRVQAIARNVANRLERGKHDRS